VLAATQTAVTYGDMFMFNWKHSAPATVGAMTPAQHRLGTPPPPLILLVSTASVDHW